MRRICTLIGLATLLAAVPAPAYAWWEFVEGLSGPGPFYGVSLDARVLCFLKKADGSIVARLPSALGVVNTSCRIDTEAKERRHAAVDIGARFLSADDDSRFANRQRISLTTLEPSASIRLIKSDRWDFVDYGFGAGVYWFSSTEFPSFSGMFLEPARVEFHATSKLRESKWAVVIPRVRVGMLVFPGGFETSSFVAAPGVPVRIGRDRVWNVGLFLDLEPLLKHLE